MRIAQVNADRGIAPGSTKGAALHLRGLAGGLRGLGHEVTTLSARRPVGEHPAPVLDIADLARLSGLTHDVVYERYSLGHLAGLETARRAGLPFVLEVNAPLVAEARTHRPESLEPRHAAAEEELLSGADLVITVSSGLASWAERFNRSVVTIPNGFEPAWFSTLPAAKTYDLAFIGHPKPWHGADRLVGLVQRLRSSGLDPAAVLIGGGPGADAVADLARSAGVGARIQVTGALEPPEASALLASARIGVAPYPPLDDFYFCPLKVLDYMAAGLAVVAADEGDIPTILGSAGLLFDPASDEDLFRKVRGLIDTPGRARDLGVAARRRAHGSMTWDHVAARTVAAIRTVAPVPAVAGPTP